MKFNYNLKKAITMILIVIITISTVCTVGYTPVYATVKNSNVLEDVMIELQDRIEETGEVVSDAASKVSAGNWWVAIRYDRLPWNFFHNAVQDDIVVKDTSIAKELTINKVEDGIETGKRGRVDLAKGVGNITFLWEVKPLSYSVEPKKSVAMAQLRKYVNSRPDEFATNANLISGGTVIKNIVVPHTGVTEYVQYTIEYTVDPSGLIFYKFDRKVTKTEPNNETVTNSVPAYFKSTSKANQNTLNPIPVFNTEVNEELEELIGEAMKYATIASSLSALHKKVNSGVHTNNTQSAAIIAACDTFLMRLSSDVVVNFIYQPEKINAAELKQSLSEFKLAVESYVGGNLVEELEMALEYSDSEAINELIKEIQNESEEYDKAGKAQPPRDPLVIDLGQVGITLCGLNSGVNFDLDNNGFAEKTAWIGTEDGFLAFDRNGNGVIDNGGELFGDQVTLKNGSKSSSGFDALTEFDSNEDKVVNGLDSDFSKLTVWIDVNHNGVSESNELKLLGDLGVVSIGLEHEEKSIIDEATGARIAESASVEIELDGVKKFVEVSEFWFPINASDTTQGDTVTVGNVPDINKAIHDDESGELFKLCYLFGESEEIAEKHYYLKKILYFITGATNIPVNSRGGNIDARDLKVIEQFMGREFVGVGGANPNTNAAAMLKEIYSDIEKQYYNVLNMYSNLGGYLKTVYEYEDENGNEVANFDILNCFINSDIVRGDDVSSLVYDLGIYLKSYDKIKGTDYYSDYQQHYSAISEHYAEIVQLTDSSSTYLGTVNNDSYRGNNNTDFIFGEAGNDTLYGGAGNDYIYGNEGDDVLDGNIGNDTLVDSSGNDTYIFAKGYGYDTVIDNGGSNRIVFSNLNSSDIRVNGTGDYDVVITIVATEDSLVIKDFCKNEELADYTLQFKDKTMHCLDENSPFRHIFGGATNDVLKAVIDNSYMNAFSGNDIVIGSKGEDFIYGNEGNDRILAGNGCDTVYGGAGDDLIYGQGGADIIFAAAGCDTIDGGAGNDYFFGGLGDDTYIWGQNYGFDVLEDNDGMSAIKLSNELKLEDINVFSAGNELLISVNGTEDKLVIVDYEANPDGYTIIIGDVKMYIKDIVSDFQTDKWENVKCTVGTENSDAIFVENINTIVMSGNQYDYIVGSNTDDIIFGDEETDRIHAGFGNDVIYGGEGHDQIFGEDEADVMVGNAGDDYINGGAGDDIIIAGTETDFIEDLSGNDIYYFNEGDGCDSIMDSTGNNTIVFGDGVLSSGIKTYRENWNDLCITFEGINDTLTIKNYCINENARNFKLIFADGAVFVADGKDSALRKMYDRQGTEYMQSIYTDGVTLVSTSGDDELIGSDSVDTLIGGKGNNRIVGNSGDDYIDGGLGKDYLCGGAGSDTYIYKRGYGTETISDSSGVNHIRISGYASSDVKAYRTNWNDITLVLDGSGELGLYNDLADKIVIEGFFVSDSNRNLYLSFNGWQIHATASASPLRIIYGTEASESIQGFDNAGFTLNGKNGCDTLNGGNSADMLYGGQSDDRILGFSGNDTLDGEAGNDYLEGGAGNDTYIFNLNSGVDTIKDNQGVNIIKIGKELDKDTIKAYRTDWNDLTITFGNSEDKLVVLGYFTSADNRKFDVVFADGTRYSYSDINNPLNQVYLTDYDDWTSAWSDDGISVDGGAGNDNLTGGVGDDIIIGGIGNDNLFGLSGNDIYIYHIGDGSDIISDNSGLNTLMLEDITYNDVEISYTKNGEDVKLVMMISHTNSELVINNYNSENYIFQFSNQDIGAIEIMDSGISFVEVITEDNINN